MKNNKKPLIIATALLTLMLTACGTSEEKLLEVTAARDNLISAKQAAEETYLDITDNSMIATLDDLASQEKEIEALNLEKLGDDKVDNEVLPKINELLKSYESISSDLGTVLNEETAAKEEKAKHAQVSAYFINKTGMNLTSIMLHDISADTYSDNYLGDGVVLNTGYTLMGTALDVYADSSEWEFVITTDSGDEYQFSCESLLGKELDGASIVLSYNSETGGVAELGSYVSEEVDGETIDLTEEGSEEGSEQGKASEESKEDSSESEEATKEESSGN